MLRGTIRKKDRAIWNQRPTLQGQINALSRKVNNIKPETQYFRIHDSHVAGTTSAQVVNYEITQSLINQLNFRDMITGDQWRNIFLKFRLQTVSNTDTVRVIAYVPKKPGVLFTPTSEHFVSMPDPTTFWVLSDRVITNKGYNGSQMFLPLSASLKNLKTIYDSSAARIEKGEIIVCVISLSATAGSTAYNYAWELGFSNL